MHRRCRAAAAGLAAVAVLLLPGIPAGADPAGADPAAAHAHADALANGAEALDAQLQQTLDALTGADQALAVATSARIVGEQRARETARAARGSGRARDDRVRALYMAGGPAAAYASVLDTGDLTTVLDRLSLVRRVLAADERAAAGAAAASTAATSEAGQTATARTQAQQAQRRADVAATRLEQLLTEQQALLAAAQRRASELDAAQAAVARQQAEAAATRLRAEQLATAAAVDAHVAQVRADAGDIPAVYLALYRRGAATCPGLSWTVLAAVGRVESRHGADPSTSVAGAQGPMQFLPSTWRTVAVDGDGDGRTDVENPADAVATAARYLCENGAPVDLHAALWAYNHAEWYVTLILSIAQQYAGQHP